MMYGMMFVLWAGLVALFTAWAIVSIVSRRRQKAEQDRAKLAARLRR